MAYNSSKLGMELSQSGTNHQNNTPDIQKWYLWYDFSKAYEY